MNGDAHFVSPRLATLQQELANGNAAALENFWHELRERGAPLIEPIAGDERNLLATFIWRAAEPIESVALVSNFTGEMGASEPLTRLLETDLWFKTHALPNNTRETYQFAIAGENLTDPLNPRTTVWPDDPELGFTGWTSSVLELPNAPPQSWNDVRDNVQHGTVTLHRFQNDSLDQAYRVWVYTPPNFSTDGAPYGWLLAFDGWFYLELGPLPTILDNLLADGLVPPLVAVMVASPLDKYRRRDLACYPPFENFVMREIVPWARQYYHLTDNPAQTAVVGASLGGLMAGYMGLHHSDTFGNVLAQSAYWGWKPTEEEEDAWLMRQYAASPKLPLRFFIEAGLFETNLPSPLPGHKNFLVSTRNMRDTLQAKGYPVHYSEFAGGHNYVQYRGSVAEGLRALLGAQI